MGKGIGKRRVERTRAKISYASQVIANFVPNFVAMATGIGRRKMQLAAFNGPSSNLWAQKSHTRMG